MRGRDGRRRLEHFHHRATGRDGRWIRDIGFGRWQLLLRLQILALAGRRLPGRAQEEEAGRLVRGGTHLLLLPR